VLERRAAELGVDLEAELRKLHDHCLARGTTSSDWQASWRGWWCERAFEFAIKQRRSGSVFDGVAEAVRALDRRAGPRVRGPGSATPRSDHGTGAADCSEVFAAQDAQALAERADVVAIASAIASAPPPSDLAAWHEKRDREDAARHAAQYGSRGGRSVR
jgi:hypothetical protein